MNDSTFRENMINKMLTKIEVHENTIFWHNECIRRCKEKIKNLREG